MSGDKNFDYQSNERRNAVRVTPLENSLSFQAGQHKFHCLDISMDGVALKSDSTIAFQESDQITFTLYENDQIIGSLKALLIYKSENRSGWQFTAVEDDVLDFFDNLVLNTQKTVLRKAASSRITQQEKIILEQEEE